ncbi:AbrB/MazE/SpoVT family DNA-binding domain-containing protein [Candidatus Woesearchaeota archaeon]|nr:AbrB/MazE/SpoVT family DNA-binding domain-containing protein [Candidatus Woesearchaeota archaeon]
MVILKMKIGPKGQVVIPKILRDKYKICPGDEVIVEESTTGVLIEKPFVDIVKIARECAERVQHNKKIDFDKTYYEQIEKRLKRAGLP